MSLRKAGTVCRICRCMRSSSQIGTDSNSSNLAKFQLARLQSGNFALHRRRFSTSSPIASGHNRWSKIRHKKGAADAQRSAIFSRLTNEIHQSLKPPNSLDPTSNSRLAAAIQKAREGGVPKTAIENIFARARAAADGSGQSVTYEAVGPGGKVAFIIECLTDNPARTVRRVKEVLHKNGCRISPTSYLFTQKGQLTITTSTTSTSTNSSCQTTFEELFEIALENGAEDVREIDQDEPSSIDNRNIRFEIITSLSDLSSIIDTFSKSPYKDKWIIESSERIFLPLDPLTISSSEENSNTNSDCESGELETESDSEALSEERVDAVERIVDILENESDVVRVWTNIG